MVRFRVSLIHPLTLANFPQADNLRLPSNQRIKVQSVHSFLEMRNVTKDFSDVKAVHDVSLKIAQGEFFCLLGASGSGKSTLLRMIAGLETPSSGHITLETEDITSVEPWNRPVSMMFQSYALFPHMNVEQNIAYGLKRDSWQRDKIEARVTELMALLQISELRTRKPRQLSGGQRQRVALARALAAKPKVLLLDEPLSALDKKLREETQSQLVSIQQETGTSFMMVTHDQDEAMSIATRIGVMDHGKLIQIDDPEALYAYPANRKVANFIGQTNVFEVKVSGTGKAQKILCADLGNTISLTTNETLKNGQAIWIAVRPEQVALKTKPARKQSSSKNAGYGVLTDVKFLGDITLASVVLESGADVLVKTIGRWEGKQTNISIGDSVEISFNKNAATLLMS